MKEMLKHKEKPRKRRRKFSKTDILVCICAGALIIGFIFYFLIVNRNGEQEIASNIKEKPVPKSKAPKSDSNLKNGDGKKQNNALTVKEKDKEKNLKGSTQDPIKPEEFKGKEKEGSAKDNNNNSKDNVESKNESDTVEEKDSNIDKEKEKDNINDAPIEENEDGPVPVNEIFNNGGGEIQDGDSNDDVPFDDSNEQSDEEEQEDEVIVKIENHADDNKQETVVSDNEENLEVDVPVNKTLVDTQTQDGLFDYGDIPKLFEVIKDGTVEQLETIIAEHKNFLEVECGTGLNALQFAASVLRVDMMRVLIGTKLFDVSAAISSEMYEGNTALHFACLAARNYPERGVEGVQLLLDNGANINAEDNQGYTPIFSSVESGRTEITQLLLDRRADINSTMKVNNESVLHFAMEICERPMIKYLIDKGANLEHVSYLNRQPIHEAAARGCVDGLRELILTRMINKQTPSPPSSAKRCGSGFEDDCLFKASPLHFAAKFKELEAVKFLFLIQSDYKATDEYDRIAHFYANSTFDLEFEDYFIQRLEFEQELAEVYDVIPDVEAKVRLTEDPRCVDAEAKYQLYLSMYLHQPRPRKKL